MSAALSIAFISLLSVAATERGDITDPDVRQAIAAYDALSFTNVVPLLKRALGRPELSPPDRRAALAYLGRAYAIFRQPADSEAAFVELLGLDPDFTPSPAESPLIREAHAGALARHLAAGGRPPGQHGTSSAPPPPPDVTTTPQDEEPRFGRPWLYGGVGAAVVLTVVLVLWRPWDSERPSGSLGVWELP